MVPPRQRPSFDRSGGSHDEQGRGDQECAHATPQSIRVPSVGRRRVSNEGMTAATRRLIISALALAVCLSLAKPAAACICVGVGAPCEAFFDASAVFIGTVVSIDPVSTTQPFSQRRVHLEVSDAFRGMTTQNVDVETGEGSGDCGYRFNVGERYLVYASVRPGSQTLTTSICTRTKPLSNAQEDAAFARAVATAPSAGGVLSGTVRNRDRRVAASQGGNPYAPIAGVSVQVQCEDGLLHRAETDTRGRFEVGGLPVGVCSARVTAPDATYVMNPPRDVTIRDLRACAEADVTIAFDGRIRGRVVDATLQPLAGVTVDALAPGARSAPNSTAAVTDAAGAYEIAKIPPGRYVIGINARQPYSRGRGLGRAIYFPGVDTVDAARTVTVGEGDAVNLDDFTLTPQAVFVQAMGIVVTGSGSPVAGAKIYLIRNEPNMFQIFSGPLVTDEAGRFTLAIPHGEPVKITAELSHPQPDRPYSFDRGDVTFVADADHTDLRIVVKPTEP
jgi:hypothetical protein